MTWSATPCRVERVRLSRPRTVPATPPPPTFDTLFAGGTVPTLGASDDDAPLAVGVAFSTTVAGSCYGVRLHTATTETGAPVAQLHDNAGTVLATVAGPTNPGAGDYDVLFVSPVVLSTSTIYAASVWHPEGRYSFTAGYFVADYTSPSGALVAGLGGSYGPGRFAYSASAPVFPGGNSTTWYGVEPLFLAG